METVRQYLTYDFKELLHRLEAPAFAMLFDYRAGGTDSGMYNHRIRDRICSLAQELAGCADASAMKDALTRFYTDFGVGILGLHKAFRDEDGRIVPIRNIRHVQLDDLIGYESAKKKLIDNTEAFLDGRPANNCLLYGDAGTGKSTSIKAIANAYFDRGLRIIEIYRHQFRDLNDIIAGIKGRNYRFIIYMDDLSFEDFETEYKYLKAVIEGGLEKKPENVLIYATSNRRHLIKESFSDRKSLSDDGDIHSNDTVQEKLSLADRFGISIYFGRPDPAEFRAMVRALADRSGIDIPDEELYLKANQWEMNHGGLSGRCAQQFIDYLLGTRSTE
jgi:predicted AAA+ superfamily ATPase